MPGIGMGTFCKLSSRLAHDMLQGWYHAVVDGPIIG